VATGRGEALFSGKKVVFAVTGMNFRALTGWIVRQRCIVRSGTHGLVSRCGG